MHLKLKYISADLNQAMNPQNIWKDAISFNGIDLKLNKKINKNIDIEIAYLYRDIVKYNSHINDNDFTLYLKYRF